MVCLYRVEPSPETINGILLGYCMPDTEVHLSLYLSGNQCAAADEAPELEEYKGWLIRLEIDSSGFAVVRPSHCSDYSPLLN